MFTIDRDTRKSARSWITLIALTLTGACATHGANYKVVTADAEPMTANLVRIVFLRPRDRDDGSGGGPAYIRLNDERTGQLRYGGFFHVDTASGIIALMASGRYPIFGACEISIEAPAGSTVYLDVGPRLSYMIAATIGTIAGAFATPNVYGTIGETAVGVTAGTAAGSTVGSGAAIVLEGTGKRCGGPLKLELISEQSALQLLENLQWSNSIQ